MDIVADYSSFYCALCTISALLSNYPLCKRQNCSPCTAYKYAHFTPIHLAVFPNVLFYFIFPTKKCKNHLHISMFYDKIVYWHFQ